MKKVYFLGKGALHEDRNMPCQDCLSIKTLANGREILAVSDGCSSSEFAAEAARCNVDVINNIFSTYAIADISFENLQKLYPSLEKGRLKGSVDAGNFASILNYILKNSLAKLAKSYGRDNFRDFCATLLFVVCEKEKTLYGHIGDGNILFFDKNGKTVFKSLADNGETSTQTYFTANSDFTEHFVYDAVKTADYDFVYLSSDGPEKMYVHECDSIDGGIYDMVVSRVNDGRLNKSEDFLTELKPYMTKAKYYVSDDWSIIVGKKSDEQPEEGLTIPTAEISLGKFFAEEFAKRRTTYEPTPVKDTALDSDDKEKPIDDVVPEHPVERKDSDDAIEGDVRNAADVPEQIDNAVPMDTAKKQSDGKTDKSDKSDTARRKSSAAKKEFGILYLGRGGRRKSATSEEAKTEPPQPNVEEISPDDEKPQPTVEQSSDVQTQNTADHPADMQAPAEKKTVSPQQETNEISLANMAAEVDGEDDFDHFDTPGAFESRAFGSNASHSAAADGETDGGSKSKKRQRKGSPFFRKHK